MIKFLIHRPIAVLMTFIAIIMLGVVASFRMPVSLMPDIAIPEITIQLSAPNSSARELENTAVKSIRHQLLQVAHVADIKSETRNSNAIIRLTFDYGTNINLAYIEVNEKIDGAMSYLPAEFERPKVIKASTTDIPVFNLHITSKNKVASEEIFLQLSEFVSSVVRRRIEQVEEVALVDMSGYSTAELKITPRENMLQSLGFTYRDIENALSRNNIQLGNLIIHDRQYRYNVRFASVLRTENDIRNIYLKKNEHLLQLKDIADVKLSSAKNNGMFDAGGQRAIVLAIIKQADARMADMKEKLRNLITEMQKDYPAMKFEIAQDQTQILDVSLSNLKQSLLYGGILAFIIMFVFIRNIKSPLLIGFTIPVSLIISILFLYLFNISINIISLSGLILGVGMMIDNSIIVIDNITQFRQRNKDTDTACVIGTNEIIRPLISSVLTTCAVFIPLIFLSGIAGALFYDQAVSVAVGLISSLIVSITLLPVLYRLFYHKTTSKAVAFENKHPGLVNAYEKGLLFFLKHQWFMGLLLVVLILASYPLFQLVPLQKLPAVSQTELIVYTDWNENINIEENHRRNTELINCINDTLEQYSSLIGRQQFLLNRQQEQSPAESQLYLKTTNSYLIDSIKADIDLYMLRNYPKAKYEFRTTENIFDRLFSDSEPSIVARISPLNNNIKIEVEEITAVEKRIKSQNQNLSIQKLPVDTYFEILLLPEKLMLYNVSQTAVYQKLKTAFNQRNVGMLRSFQRFVPIVIGEKQKSISEILSSSYVSNSEGDEIPVSSLTSIRRATGFKSITAAKEGEYIPLIFNDLQVDKTVLKEIEKTIKSNNRFDVLFSGSWFTNRDMFKGLLWVLLISVLLLYFILASQFESLLQPFIVLIELPVDICGALLMLYIFNSSLNLMSAIGIIVMSGIIINDSILKIDTINQLRKQGMSVKEAILEGGRRRLNPIIMTSLTTILALVPILFTSGLGSELQLPLALSVIGGMTVGTFVSIYAIPVVYNILSNK